MIKKAKDTDLDEIVILALELWPENTQEDLTQEMSEILHNAESAFFLAYDGSSPVGFAQCQLRHDYVEGTDSSPVGYLEGIYVRAPYRRQGDARQLLDACEAGAASMNCTEFASDCSIDNLMSQSFHHHTGFIEAGRIVCFTKKISRKEHA